jgi:3',5'-cyclic AMP phosphodiesterase CpdA
MRISLIRSAAVTAAAFSLGVPAAAQQTVAAPPQDSVRAIAAARQPIPPESRSAGVTTFSFIVYGDTRSSEDGIELQVAHGAVVKAMVDSIVQRRATADPIRFILQSGDAVVDGRNPAQWNVSFVGLIDRLTTEGGIPYFLAPGNHDVTSATELAMPGRQAGLTNYLQAMAKLIPPDGATRRLRGYPTYAFGYGNTFVVAFDSNIADDSTQFAWVKAQLEGLDRKRYPNVVAFFHHPVFSSGPHGGPRLEPQTAALRAMWMPLLRRHHVRFLFAGHDHLYEHWVEHYHDASGTHRIDQIVSGGGGAPPYGYAGEPDLTTYLAAGASDSVRVEHVVRPGATPADNPYHFLIIHVDGENVSMEVIGVGRDFQPYPTRRVSLADAPAGR